MLLPFLAGAVLGERIKLTEEQRLDWLRLIRTDNIGPRGIMAQMPQGLS